MSSNQKPHPDEQRQAILHEMGLPIDAMPVFLRESVCTEDITHLDDLIESKDDENLIHRLQVIRSLMAGKPWESICSRHHISLETLITWTKLWNECGLTWISQLEYSEGRHLEFPPLRAYFRGQGSDILIGDKRPRVVPRFNTPFDRAARKELLNDLERSIAMLNKSLGIE